MNAPALPPGVDAHGRRPGWVHEHVCVSGLLLGGHPPSELRLTPEDFADPLHCEIWRLACDLEARGEPLDPPTLRAAAERSRVLRVEDFDRAIDAATHHIHSAPEHADRLRDHARRRRLRDTALALLEADGRELDRDPGEFVSEWSAKLADTAADGGGAVIVSGAEAVAGAVAGIADLMKGTRPGFTLGLPKIDRMLGGGLQPGRLAVLAAGTGAGKTSLAVQAVRLAGRAGSPVLVISLEMTAAQVVQRATLCDAGLAEADLVQGERAASIQALDRHVGRAREDFGGVDFIDRALRPRDLVGEIRAWSRRIGGGPGLVVIDYLQLVPPSDERARRERQIADVVGLLKNDVVGRLGHACLALSQFNREGAKSEHGPELHHLRESGAIEQFAEAVIFMYGREAPAEHGRERPIWIKIAKNRYGVSNVRVAGAFDAGRGRISEVEVGR